MPQMAHDPEHNRDFRRSHTHPACIVMHWSAVKVNILCCKLALRPSGSLVSTYNTCISSSHCSQSDHMLRSVITAECLQSSHINTCVKPAWGTVLYYFFFSSFFRKTHKIGWWVDTISLMAPSKLSAHLRQSM